MPRWPNSIGADFQVVEGSGRTNHNDDPTDMGYRGAHGDDRRADGGNAMEMMIAAIYARKSTEQTGMVDEQKSVARQVAHARDYAQRKGWTVDEASVYIDDGISGAEFAKRPGFVRLMNALAPRPRFQVLVMSEE